MASNSGIHSTLLEIRESYSVIEEGNRNTIEVHKKLEKSIEYYSNAINGLENGFEKFNELSSRGQDIFRTMKTDLEGIRNEINGFSQEVQNSLRGQSKALEGLTKDIAEKLPQSLETLNQLLTNQVKQFIAAYEEYMKNTPKGPLT